MKLLIWIIGYAVMTLVYTLTAGIFANAGSFVLWIESVVYFVAWIWVSIVLCKKWDNHKMGKWSLKVPPSCLQEAETYRGRTTELNAFIRSCVKLGKITKKQAKYMEKEYSKPLKY